MFTRMCEVFAKFYFDEPNWLAASARRPVLEELTQRVARLHQKNEVLALLTLPDRFNWKVGYYAAPHDASGQARC